MIPIFINRVMNDEVVMIDGDGMQTRDFTYVENAVQANVKAFFAIEENIRGKVFNIAVGENFSVNHIYETITHLLKKENRPKYRASRKGDVRDSLADISQAVECLGYRPVVRFEEGIQKTIQYFSAGLQVRQGK